MQRKRAAARTLLARAERLLSAEDSQEKKGIQHIESALGNLSYPATFQAVLSPQKGNCSPFMLFRINSKVSKVPQKTFFRKTNQDNRWNVKKRQRPR